MTRAEQDTHAATEAVPEQNIYVAAHQLYEALGEAGVLFHAPHTLRFVALAEAREVDAVNVHLPLKLFGYAVEGSVVASPSVHEKYLGSAVRSAFAVGYVEPVNTHTLFHDAKVIIYGWLSALSRQENKIYGSYET